MTDRRDAASSWTDLSWGDLEAWVGARSLQRGRAYQRQERVLDLACSAEGVLTGTVQGSYLYRTVVWRAAGGALSSSCSCPLGGECKHAVAVVVEYLERVKAGTEVPSEPSRAFSRVSRSGTEAEPPPGLIEDYLGGLAPEELVALVLELAEVSAEVADMLHARAELATGAVEDVVRSIREELRRVASEPGWQNYWRHEGFIPDYRPVRLGLESLLAAGQADQVVQLGEEILRVGTRHVEESDDEGETGAEVSAALEPVWPALVQSSLGPAQRILWLYERFLEDEYGLCFDTQSAASVWEVEPAVWGEVADALVERLGTEEFAVGEDWGSNYRRTRLSDWAIDALRNAGRTDEALDLALTEAPATDSYVRVVDLLIEAERFEEARALAYEGIGATSASLPGIAEHLRERLAQMAARAGDLPMQAALAADGFLARPGLSEYRTLRHAAERAGVWPEVRAQVLSALQSGDLPTERADWPLPATGIEVAWPRRTHPLGHAHLLTEIALDEGDHDRALRWYATLADSSFGWGDVGLAEQVAVAVGPTHPDEAAALWKARAEGEIARTNRGGYEASLRYLRRLRRLLCEAGREEEWEAYLAELRNVHSRKRAFLETLELLDRDGPIIGP